MKALGERSIASFIRTVLDAAWWLVAVGLTLLTGVLLLSFCVNLDGDNLTMDLPVALVLDAPVYGGGVSPQTDAQIGKLRGNLRFPVRSGAFLSGTLLLIVVLFGFLLSVLTLLRYV